MDEDSSEQRVQMAAAILSLLYASVSLLWLMWMLIPSYRRRLLLMRVTWSLRQTARNAAYHAGRQAMDLETRGSSPNYHLPYGLSLLAEQADRAYEKLRFTA